MLPEAFTSDPDRLARFEREAKMLASLNHTNIGHVYGLGEPDGVKALVLELVEGPRWLAASSRRRFLWAGHPGSLCQGRKGQAI